MVLTLAVPHSCVALVSKMLRQRGEVAARGAPVAAEVDGDPRSVWAPAGEQRRARRHADGLLAVAAQEDHRAVGEGVDVRRDRRHVPPHPPLGLEGAQLRPQVCDRRRQAAAAVVSTAACSSSMRGGMRHALMHMRARTEGGGRRRQPRTIGSQEEQVGAAAGGGGGGGGSGGGGGQQAQHGHHDAQICVMSVRPRTISGRRGP